MFHKKCFVKYLKAREKNLLMKINTLLLRNTVGFGWNKARRQNSTLLKMCGQLWYLAPLTPVLRRLRQTDCEFQALSQNNEEKL